MATGQSFDIVVVGAGPAGLAAAIEAAKRGARTLVVDENNKPGGQLFKQIHKFFGSHEHRAGVRGYDIGRQLLDEAANSGVTVWLDTVVHGLFDSRVAVLREGRHVTVETGRIILATGPDKREALTHLVRGAPDSHWPVTLVATEGTEVLTDRDV